MKILITGGAGFIGSHLVDSCVARGDTVSLIDNLNVKTPQQCEVFSCLQLFFLIIPL